MAKETLIITLYDGAAAKTVMRTDVYPLLQKRFSIVLLVSEARRDAYAKEFPNVEAVVSPRASHPRLEEFLSRVFLYGLHTQTVRSKIDFGKARGDAPPLHLFKLLLWRLGRYALFKTLARALYGLVPDHSFDGVLTQYRPVAVFCTAMTGSDDFRLIKAARRFRVPSFGMPKGWDNLTSKTFFSLLPDHILVQSEVMREDLIAYHGIPSSRIKVTGFPQFDVYANRNALLTRAEFAAKMGLDPTRKIILYAAAGDQLAPNDEEVINHLVAFLNRMDDATRPQLLIRPHPKYAFREHAIAPYPYLKIDYPGVKIGGAKKEWEFRDTDVAHLAKTLFHCDLLICTLSTLMIEAAIFDKPVISIGYDGDATVPDDLSIRRYESYDHLVPVIRSGGVRIVRGQRELTDSVETYLQHPELDRKGREILAREQAAPIDGRSGRRVAEAVSAVVESR